MPQILKDSVRNKIIEASLIEFSINGYKGASLRNIAKKADMTVGNLYRYYKNKEDLFNNLLADSEKQFKEVLKSINEYEISSSPRVFEISMNNGELLEKLDELTKLLIDIRDKKYVLLPIIFNDSPILEEIVKCLDRIFKDMVKQYFNDDNYNADILTRSYAVGVTSSIKEILLNKEIKKEEATRLVNYIFKSYITMLEVGLRNNLD